MSNANDFVINDGVLVAYNGNDSHMAIPEGVTAIVPQLLQGKSHVTSVTIPSSVTEIGTEAFSGSWGWNSYPECFTIHLSDLDAFLRMKHFYFMPLCNRRFVINGDVLEELTIPGTMKEVMHLFSRCEDLKKVVFSEGVEQIALEAFKRCKNLKHVCLPKSLKTIENDAFSGCPLSRLEIAEGASFKIGRIFGYTYPTGLEEQVDQISQRMDAAAIKEYIMPDRWKLLSEDSKARIYLAYQDVSMRKYYKKLLKPADFDPLSAAILNRLGQKLTKKECAILADFMTINVAYLSSGTLKNMFDTIQSQKSGSDALADLKNSAAVMKKLSAEPTQEAPKVACGPRSKNDVAFDNMGFDDAGVKVYDLGSKVVHAVIQPDFQVMILDPKTGKTSKSVPKKGAAPELYAAAAEDFKALFKGIKVLYSICKDALYTLYLTGETLSPDVWRLEWMGNPITRTLTSMTVWQQGEAFFTLEGRQLVTVDGTAYALTADSVRVAHTGEMEKEAVTAWQQYFTAHNRKQSFLQIWEPVRKGSDIRPERYQGTYIRNGYMYRQKTLGIDVYFMPDGWSDNFPGVFLTLEGFDVEVGPGKDDSEFEIKSIVPKVWNRRSNAIISFLDRVCIYGRLHQDDETILEALDQFTYEQIVDFLAMATKHALPKVTALLLDYKQNRFADYDPMEEFILEL